MTICDDYWKAFCGSLAAIIVMMVLSSVIGFLFEPQTVTVGNYFTGVSLIVNKKRTCLQWK